MKDYINERKNKLLNIFLIIVILLALIGILNSLSNYFLKNPLINLGLQMDNFIHLVVFVFAIICLIQFRRQKLNWLTFVVPIWLIVFYVILVILGIISAILHINNGIALDLIVKSSLFEIFGLLSNLFVLAFASFLLRRFRK